MLYANTNHPEWKTEFPNWVDRCKQILKKWRALPSEQKAPYLQRARDNRSAIRMKKAQQVRAFLTRSVCANHYSLCCSHPCAQSPPRVHHGFRTAYFTPYEYNLPMTTSQGLFT